MNLPRRRGLQPQQIGGSFAYQIASSLKRTEHGPAPASLRRADGPVLGLGVDEREIVRHYTLSAADIELVAKRRAGATQLGFAVLLCGMRFPGRVLDVHETPPATVLAFIADQVGVPVVRIRHATGSERPTGVSTSPS